jgi:hypothetical protein
MCLVSGGSSLSNQQDFELGGFAATINSRLAAEARLARAIGFGWLCGGAAIAACLTAAGIVCALYGYSYMIGVKPAADEVASALARALETAELKATVTGTISLDPKAELKLAPGQSVKLLEGTVVRLEPNSTVRVVGNITMPQPSARQLQANAMNGDRLPFTSYTIFRSVAYGSGRVETGWNFDLSDPNKPRSQYCSYIQSIARGAQVKDVIAVNGVPLPVSQLVRDSFNFEGAVGNCMWFSGI